MLEVSDLSVSFNELKVLEHVSFTLESGDILAIIGPNGSGKTVLLRALLETVPYEGEIKWAKDVKIGYVPQKLYIDPSLPITLKEFLESKLKLIGKPKEDLGGLLKLVNLPPAVLTRSLGQLSGGHFQRALIAFALIGSPQVILFDEPTAGVDSSGEEQIYNTLHRLRDERGITMIIVSHDLSLVFNYTNKVLCLNKQQICFGSPEEALTPEKLRELYGAPVKHYHHLHG
ncbi:MAG TPA: metal ABC transporter ATP-binding protein [Candidatus Tyrphobacter sp.]|nr:metal ABC transporter ATP-binding protein [Candidatus Tyrphobacter sp.]